MDDLLLYLRNPESSIPYIMSILNSFGTFSGYKLNIQKRECFPINQAALTMSMSSIPFQCFKLGFKYLGVFITQSIRTLKERNFTALIEKIKTDQQKCGHLPLSLVGRVQIIERSVLQRYYIFSSVFPSSCPDLFFFKNC